MTIIEQARELLALTEKATQGRWQWWTSNSWRRLTAHALDGSYEREGDVLSPVICWGDKHPDLSVSQADMAHIAAANPTVIAALCRALIVRTEALQELVACDDMIDQQGMSAKERHDARVRGKLAWKAARRALDEPHTGQGGSDSSGQASNEQTPERKA